MTGLTICYLFHLPFFAIHNIAFEPLQLLSLGFEPFLVGLSHYIHSRLTLPFRVEQVRQWLQLRLQSSGYFCSK